jgi:ribosomal protein L1
MATEEQIAAMTNEQIAAEVKKAGLRVVPLDHVTELENLAKRIDGLTLESHESHDAAIETRDGMKQLGEDMKLLLEIRGEIGKIWRRVTDLERADAAKTEALKSFETDITGIHKRLVVVEETFTKKSPRIPRAIARRKKGKRK